MTMLLTRHTRRRARVARTLVVALAVSVGGCSGKTKSSSGSGASQATVPADLIAQFNDLVSSTNTDIANIESRDANSTDLKVLKKDVKAIHDVYKSFDTKLAKVSFPKSFGPHVDALLAVDGRIEASLEKMQSANSVSSLQSQSEQFTSLAGESQQALATLRTDLGLPTNTSGAPDAPSTLPSGTDNTEAIPAPDPCALISESTVESVTGQQVTGTKGSPASDPSRVCDITLGSGTDTLEITTLTGFAAERSLASDKTLFGVSPVSDLGDEAYTSSQDTTHNVTVRKGSTVVRLFLVLNDKPGAAGAGIALELAKKAVSKL
jgi:hypothetical protein